MFLFEFLPCAMFTFRVGFKGFFGVLIAGLILGFLWDWVCMLVFVLGDWFVIVGWFDFVLISELCGYLIILCFVCRWLLLWVYIAWVAGCA